MHRGMYWYEKEPLAGFQLMKYTTKESLKSLLFWLNLATEDLSAKFMLDNYFYNGLRNISGSLEMEFHLGSESRFRGGKLHSKWRRTRARER
jgi:hypothetical protein